eukprot:1156649-Pelagomonas_calceolata.AAC.10
MQRRGRALCVYVCVCLYECMSRSAGACRVPSAVCCANAVPRVHSMHTRVVHTKKADSADSACC